MQILAEEEKEVYAPLMRKLSVMLTVRPSIVTYKGVEFITN